MKFDGSHGFSNGFSHFQVMQNVDLPRLDVGDYVMFKNMGAYTAAISGSFNGFTPPRVEYYIERKHS